MNAWREQALALREDDPDLTMSEIARRVGVQPPAVWKLFNPERFRESDRRTRDKRRARRQEVDRTYSANKRSTCETCGGQCGIGSGKAGRPSRQCASCTRRATDERRAAIVALWNAGKPIHEIAAALGTSENSMNVTLVRMRRKGLIGYRYQAYDSAAKQGNLASSDKLAPATRERPGAVAHEETGLMSNSGQYPTHGGGA